MTNKHKLKGESVKHLLAAIDDKMRGELKKMKALECVYNVHFSRLLDFGYELFSLSL